MTGPELRQRLESLTGPTKTVITFARMIDVTKVSVHRWIADDPPPPHWVGVILDLLEACPQRHLPPEWKAIVRRG